MILPVLLTILALPAHQQRFFLHLIPLWQAIPGRLNALNLTWNERTVRRWFERERPWAALHWNLVALLVRVGALDPRFVPAIDASFVPKSGTRISGLGAFRNGAQHRSDTGLELSCIAVLSCASPHVFPVSLPQTQPKQDCADRLVQSFRQLTTLLAQRRTWFKGHLRAVVADGQYAK